MGAPESESGMGAPAPALTRILALDLSLTSTGVAPPHERPFTFKPQTKGVERLAEFEKNIALWLTQYDPSAVVIEGYSFSSVGRQHATGEMGGVVRLALHVWGVPVAEVPPASLKKFATGKGNAGKDEMIAAAIRRFGFEGYGNNEADAWLLRCMGVAAYGHLGPNPLQYRHDALAGVEWPEVNGVKPSW